MPPWPTQSSAEGVNIGSKTRARQGHVAWPKWRDTQVKPSYKIYGLGMIF